MDHVWAALSSRPQKWRKVVKALTLLEHMVKNGPERTIDEVRRNSFRLQSLVATFAFIDADGKDRGASVREKAESLNSLVADVELVRFERDQASQIKSRFVGFGARQAPSSNIRQTDTDSDAYRERLRVEQARSAARQARERAKATAQHQHSLPASKTIHSDITEVLRSETLKPDTFLNNIESVWGERPSLLANNNMQPPQTQFQTSPIKKNNPFFLT